MKIARAGFLLAGLLTFAAATTAEAVVITFDQQNVSGGSISYDGALGVDTFVGTDIAFDIVSVDATQLTCVGCLLDFETGVSTSEPVAPVPGVVFATGGSFVITGTIFDGLNLVATGTLLSGTFTGTPFAAGGPGGGIFSLLTGTDTKNEDLLAYFGLAPNSFVYASTNIVAQGCDTNLADGFDCVVTEADVINQQQVPEPGSLLLFGMALVGAGRVARRRLARK